MSPHLGAADVSIKPHDDGGILHSHPAVLSTNAPVVVVSTMTGCDDDDDVKEADVSTAASLVDPSSSLPASLLITRPGTTTNDIKSNVKDDGDTSPCSAVGDTNDVDGTSHPGAGGSVLDTPKSPVGRQGRIIKPRREDGFVYAGDNAAPPPASPPTPIVAAVAATIAAAAGTASSQDQKLIHDDDDDVKQQHQQTSISLEKELLSPTTMQQQPKQSQQSQQQQQLPHLTKTTTTTAAVATTTMTKKRPRNNNNCPIRDTMLIQVPLTVCADIGIAMRRTRIKRSKRIKRWLATAAAAAAAAAATTKSTTKSTSLGDAVDREGDSVGNNECGTDNNDGKQNSIVKCNNNDDDDDSDDDEGEPLLLLKSHQYGSVLDYLEAKYTRGVMIDDFDETLQQHSSKRKMTEKKKEKMKANVGNSNEGENDDIIDNGEGADTNDDDDDDDESSVDSEPSGVSVYSNDGFIDDTLLHEEVAGQVLASSAFGKTQIEEEAQLRKRQREDKRTQRMTMLHGIEGKKRPEEIGGSNDDDDKLSNCCNDDFCNNNSNDDDYDDMSSNGGNGSDFDDGFFVNFGDLEMSAGWMGDEIHIPSTSSSTVKMKKKGGAGRPPGAKNKNGGNTKSEDKIPKKKIGRPPGAKNLIKTMKKEGDGKLQTKSKKQLSKNNDNGVANTVVVKKKKKKKPKSDDEGEKMNVVTNVTKTKKVTDGVVMKKRKKTNTGVMVDETSTILSPKKKKMSHVVSVLEGVATRPNDNNNNKVDTALSEKTDENNTATNYSPLPPTEDDSDSPPLSLLLSMKEKKKKPSSPSSQPVVEVSIEKAKSAQLRALYKRRYTRCIKQIKEMTPDELPRKVRNKNTMKVSVNIPPDKDIGDEITFGCVLYIIICLRSFFSYIVYY